MNLLPIKTQQGYISIVVVVFLIILALVLYPVGPPKPVEENCTVGEPPGGYFEISGIPAIKDMYIPAQDDFSGNEPTYGGQDPNETATYVLIRKNVPTSKKSLPEGWDFLGETAPTTHTHTINVGELSVKPGFDAYYPSRWGEMNLSVGMRYIRNMGLLLFANNNPATIRQEGDNTIYMLDIYQDKRIYDDKTKDYTENDIFLCNQDTTVGSTFVTDPAQAKSQTRDQLQLQWFLFTSDKVWSVHCKPAVYLYPPKRQLVNVRVSPKGELSYTDPPYDPTSGWSVWANPNSSMELLDSTPIKSGYLYYESKLRDSEIKKPTSGWVVKFNELETLYQKILPQLGLNEKEKTDFINYWRNKLPASNYYFVGLVDKSQRDYLETLSVTPSPDTSIRFSLFFEALDRSKAVDEPKIITPQRKGFTLVDWGGMVKLHPGTPFTCSQ